MARISSTPACPCRGPRPWIDVTAYGAVGNGSGNDRPFIQNALNAVPATGGTVYFPPGQYICDIPLTLSNKHIHILGAGRGVSTIHWNGATGGLDFTFGAYDYRLTVSSISLVTWAANGGVGIRATWPPFVGGPTSGPHIYDIHIGPWAPACCGYWSKGIELTNASGVKIQNFDIHGQNNTFNMSHGIHLINTSTIANIHSGYIFSCDRGFAMGGTPLAEGAYISDVHVGFANIGFLLDAPGAGSAIRDCHASTYQYGIYLFQHSSMALIGNRLSHAGGSWMGIYVVHSVYCRIIGNEITSIPGSGTRNGIVLHGTSSNGTVQGNVVRSMETGIWLVGGGSDWNIVSGNRIPAWTINPILNSGVNNLVADNLF